MSIIGPDHIHLLAETHNQTAGFKIEKLSIFLFVYTLIVYNFGYYCAWLKHHK